MARLSPPERHAIRLYKHGSFTEAMIQLSTGLRVQELRELRKKHKLPKVRTWDERNTLSKLHWRIGNRLLFVRMVERNLSDSDLSVKLGWTLAKYSRVERGLYPLELLDLEALARYFTCTISDILNCQFGIENK